MAKKLAALAMAVLFGCGALSFAAFAYRSYDESVQEYPMFSESVHRADGEYAVIVKTDGTRPDLRSMHPTYTVEGPDNTYVMCFDTSSRAKDAVAQAQTLRGVEYAEQNGTVHAQGDVRTYTTYGAKMIGVDQFAGQLLQRGSLSDVVVAVVDSGITPELAIFQDRLLDGFSFVQGVGGAMMPYDADAFGHGTAVAGIIAECTQDLPVKILPIRILDDTGSGTFLDTANGIRCAVDQGADVVNLSFVAKSCSQYLHEAVRYALSGDALTVTAAGNYGYDMEKRDCCPSHLQDGIVVSGCAEDGSLYKKTCYGPSVDVTAPAVDVPCMMTSGKTGYADGTSFAAPHVSAAAAMLKLYKPDADVAALTALLTMHTRDLGDAGYDVYFGWGVPDLRLLDGAQTPQDVRYATGMTIVTLPHKMDYYYKEPFEPDGFSAQMRYSDGTSALLTTGFTFTGAEHMHRGANTISAQMGGQHAEFAVDVRFHWWQWLIWIPLLGFIWYK